MSDSPAPGSAAAAPNEAVSDENAESALARVPWLGHLDDEVRGEIAGAARAVTFRAGQTIVAELEAGDDVDILTAGHARVTVGGGARGDLHTVATLGPGDVIGELAFLTRELRSATVIAHTPVRALLAPRDLMTDLLARHPSIAARLLDRLAQNLHDTDEALAALLAPRNAAIASANSSTAAAATQHENAAMQRLRGHSASLSVTTRGSIARSFRELVLAHRQELPFVALTAFVTTLLSLRLAVFLCEHAHAPLFPLLRAAYLGGLALVFSSTGLLLFRFRRAMRRLVALGYGIGFALIFNELSVFLAFDVFWLDMTHRDTSLAFDPVRLYSRNESSYAVGVALAVLLQIAFLRRFWRRSFFVVTTRVRGLIFRR